MAKLPRVEAREVNPFGGFEQLSEEDLLAAPRDRFYLPGWSDRRTAWEAARAAWERDGRRGTPPKPLDVRMQFVSVERATGSPDGTKMAQSAADGYRPLKWSEAEEFGLQLGDADAGYTCAARPDGQDNVRVGSQVLMVTDQTNARRNLARVRAAQQAQEDDIHSRLDDVAAEYNRRMGHKGASGTAFELVQENAASDD